MLLFICFAVKIFKNLRIGCHLEKVALSLKDSYLSMSPEDQFQAAQKLVWTLSTMLSSPSSDYCNRKLFKCMLIYSDSLLLTVFNNSKEVRLYTLLAEVACARRSTPNRT